MIIKFDDAPENVRKLAFAFMEASGPVRMLELSPEHFLIFGKNVGLDAKAHVAAIRWLAKHYAAQKQGSIVNNEMARMTAKRFEEYAAKLEQFAASRPADDPQP